MMLATIACVAVIVALGYSLRGLTLFGAALVPQPSGHAASGPAAGPIEPPSARSVAEPPQRARARDDDAAEPEGADAAVAAEPTHLYSWRDERGVVHVRSTPPERPVDGEVRVTRLTRDGEPASPSVVWPPDTVLPPGRPSEETGSERFDPRAVEEPSSLERPQTEAADDPLEPVVESIRQTLEALRERQELLDSLTGDNP